MRILRLIKEYFILHERYVEIRRFPSILFIIELCCFCSIRSSKARNCTWLIWFRPICSERILGCRRESAFEKFRVYVFCACCLAEGIEFFIFSFLLRFPIRILILERLLSRFIAFSLIGVISRIKFQPLAFHKWTRVWNNRGRFLRRIIKWFYITFINLLFFTILYKFRGLQLNLSI